MRVLVADDHAVVREGIRHVLSSADGFEVIGEAGSGEEALALGERLAPDVIILDISMPRGSGLEVTPRLRERVPAARVLILSVYDREEYVLQSVRAGAHGYLLKDIDPRRLPEALFDVHSGNSAIPRPLVSRMLEEFRDVNPRRRSVPESSELDARLTSREWQVLDLLARDNTTAEIAGRLVLSPSAVRAHIAAIVKKFDARDRNEAVELFRRRSGI
jgi:DNA-binding NarL/FixJ family response regulator